MPEPNRLTEFSSGFELDFVEREGTPESAMKLGIQLYAAGLSLSDTVSVLAGLGVDRCRSTVHNWVKKVGLQPASGKNPNYVAVDETVIRLNNPRFWLYAAVDPESNEFLHVRPFLIRTIVLTKQFLQKLAEKHDVVDASGNLTALAHRELSGQLNYRKRNHTKNGFTPFPCESTAFTRFSGGSRASAERWLRRFRYHYNHERPNQALNRLMTADEIQN